MRAYIEKSMEKENTMRQAKRRYTASQHHRRTYGPLSEMNLVSPQGRPIFFYPIRLPKDLCLLQDWFKLAKLRPFVADRPCRKKGLA